MPRCLHLDSINKIKQDGPKLRELEEWKAGRLGTPASAWSICTCGLELISQSPLDLAHHPMIRRRLLVSAFSPAFQASTPPIFRSSGGWLTPPSCKILLILSKNNAPPLLVMRVFRAIVSTRPAPGRGRSVALGLYALAHRASGKEFWLASRGTLRILYRGYCFG